ncbi:MAG: lysophospholipid acyltransferase family protein [Flammeovirgaceae bacterium]
MSDNRPFKKRLKYFFLYYFILTVVGAARLLPRAFMISVFGFFGKLAFFLLKKERLKVHKHLRMAFKNEKTETELNRIAKQTFVNLGKNAVDVFRYAVTDDLTKIVKIEGKEHFDKALEAGKGVVGLTCHLGSFDTGAAFVHQLGYKINIVGAPLKDPRLDKLVHGNRVLKGAKYIPRGGSSLPLIRALKAGETVFLLIDQDIPKIQGVFVNFFGIPAYTPIGAALMAMKTGAKVIPFIMHRNPDDTHTLTIDQEIPIVNTGNEQEDLVTNTQAMTNVLERFIRLYPEQWVWMHERWNTKPENLKAFT